MIEALNRQSLSDDLDRELPNQLLPFDNMRHCHCGFFRDSRVEKDGAWLLGHQSAARPRRISWYTAQLDGIAHAMSRAEA